jgi:pyrroline-5-carboxylate reductase
MTTETLQIGFIGAGKMATALARGWIEAGICPAHHMLASDV